MAESCKTCDFADNERSVGDMSGKRVYDCFGIPPQLIVAPDPRGNIVMQAMHPVVDGDMRACAHYRRRKGTLLAEPTITGIGVPAPLDGGQIEVRK